MDDKFDSVIKKVIFRGEKSWIRMDIEVETPERTIHTHICEFIEHYQPEGVPKFNANKLFQKTKKYYGFEYEINVK